MELPPKTFRGDSHINASLFLEYLDGVFIREPRETEQQKIAYGASLLAGRAQKLWQFRGGRQTRTYRDFENFVLSTVPDRTKPELSVVMEYFELKQRDDQSVEDFVVELEDLEAQMPRFTDVQRVLHLLAKLREPLRLAIVGNHGVPNTRLEVIALARQVES